MKHAELILTITDLFKTPLVPFVWGPPGIGKSAAMLEAAKQIGVPLIDLRASDLDFSDIRGLPYFDQEQKVMRYAPMAQLPRDGSGILFLDELSTAAPDIQATLYQLIFDRRVGDYQLPEGWFIVAAGNTEKDAAVVHAMSSALASRMIHLQLEIDLDDWVQWALTQNLDHRLIAFLKFKDNLLHCFQPESMGTGHHKGFPCPRTWAFVSTVLTHCRPESYDELIEGTVGEAAATEFMAFLELSNELPNPDEALNAPLSTPVPTDIGAQYAMAVALTHRLDQHNLIQGYTYLQRCEPEISTLAYNLIKQHNPDLINTTTGIRWTADIHNDAF